MNASWMESPSYPQFMGFPRIVFLSCLVLPLFSLVKFLLKQLSESKIIWKYLLKLSHHSKHVGLIVDLKKNKKGVWGDGSVSKELAGQA